MEVIVGKLGGFCPGVENSVEKAQNSIKSGKAYCLGELVHNEQVVEELEKDGMITVNSLEEVPNNSNVIFRAHGEPKSSYEKAKEKNLNIIDLTCPNVCVIHKKVEKEKDHSFIIIIGKKSHPEVIGTKGFSGENSFVIESEDDIIDCFMEYEKTNLGRVYVVSQTTISSSKFDKIVEEIKTNFIEADVIVDKTICNTTENRQKEVSEISKDVNKMIIIGGKHSSNTKELAKIAEQNCGKVYLIQTAEELKNEKFSKEDKVGVMGGASTPQKIIDDVVKMLSI